MPLDLEPVHKLDLEPAGGQALDLQPALDLEPADQLPPGVQAKALEEMMVSIGGPGAIDAYRQAEMIRKGGSVITSPQEVLAKKVSKAQMTREEMKALGLPEWLAPIERGVATGAGGLQDPENLLYMGVGGGAAKPIMQGFILDMIRQGVTQAGGGALDLAQGNTDAGLEKIAGAATVAGAMYGLHRLGQVPIEKRAAAPEPAAPKVPVSEFGGERPPPSSQPGPVNAAPGANASDVSGATVPETPKTLESQLDWLKTGKRQAVLVPNETALPPIPEGMASHPTAAGTFIFDPARIAPAALDAHVQADTVGDLLGYGIPSRPAEGQAVVTVRGPDGVEKQAVVTDQASLPKVLDAAKKVADPTDKVAVEPAEKVIEGRQQGAPVASVPASEIATRPDLMQFKRMDDTGSGVNASDKLGGEWDDLKAGNLLLWEPQDPAAHGLEPGQKYIVANGHHRFEFGERKGRQAYNAQVVREADGYSAGDARALAAEINIADGKGTIYDQVKFLRNEAATHGTDAAVARAGRTGTKGRQAQTIAFQAGSELFHSFINERISPEQAEAIAAAAPESEGLQRLGVRKAVDGASPAELRNLIQAVRLEAKAVPAEQFDLFAADDTAIKTAEDLAKVASRIQGELAREIRATETAAKNATTAKAKGIRFDRPPEEILAENAKLKGERDRWDNWALHPDLVAQVRGYAEMGRSSGGKRSVVEPAAPPEAAPKADPILDWFNKAIEATDPLDRTKPLEGITGAPIWLAKGAANAVLQVSKAVYVTTRDLAHAIAAGIEHLRRLNVPGFDEAQARAWLQNALGERATGQKVLSSDVISDPVKESIQEYLYTRRTNATDQDLADGLVRDYGVDQAQRTFFDPPSSMPGSVRSKLLGSITRTLASQERQARSAGDVAAAQALAKRQADIWNQALPLITDMAQSLQALTDLVELSPEAQVQRLQGRLEQKATEALDAKRDQVDLVGQAIDAGRNEGIEAVKQDAEVNRAAAAAVDEAVTQSEDVKRAVVMEMAEPWASSSAVMDAAREQVRLRADELLNKQPFPKGLSAAQHARKILDDLAERAASIFAGHLQGAEPQVDLVDKLMQRLGLERKPAVSLAGALAKEWDRQLKAAQAAIPKRIARQRVARNLAATGGVPEGAPDRLVDAAIRKQLRDLNVKLGEVLRQEAERQDQTGAHVGERVVQASGLTGEKADTLRTTLVNRWNTLVSNAQRAKLEALQRNSGVRVSRPMKSAFEKLVELTRLGALTSERFYDVVKDSLKLKRLTPEDAAQLRALVQKAQDLPEGYLRQQAASDVLKLTERLSGNASLRDLPLAIFYANILSGLTTPAKIAFENINLLAGGTIAAFITRPRELLHPLDYLTAVAKAYGRGLKKGAGQAAGTLRTGVVSGVWEQAKTPTILEMKPFGEKLEPLNFWKWFTRSIGISHELTFKPAWEVRQLLTARETAAREGLSGKALEQRTADLLANTDAQVAQARAQALHELQMAGQLDALNLARRTGEILEQQREINMPGSTAAAREFALRTAYLNEPYGFLGLLTTQLRSGLEKARQEFPIFGTGVKTQIPFTTIVANILNEKLNWTPIGIARAARAGRTGEIYGRPVMPGDRAELTAKAIVGTLALGALYTLLGDRINGNGPSDPGKRKQLQEAGWIPHSIKIGDRYHSYMHTPLGLGLAVIGNLNDWYRYGKGDDTGAAGRVTFALKATLNAIISQGMLDSVRRIFDTVGSESTAQGAEKLEKLAARTASSFVIPNLIQQVDRMFDPTQYDQTGIEALVLSQIPFVRRGNKPSLNVLGDPVQAGPWHHWASKVTEDALLRTLAEKQAWIPTPDRQQIVGDKKRGPEFFRALTPDEFYDFVAISGREIRRRLQDNIDVIATSEPDKARQFVAKIADQERTKAKKQFE